MNYTVRYLLFSLIFVAGWLSNGIAAHAQAVAPPSIPIDTLHAPTKAADLVQKNAQASYERTLTAYRNALVAHPKDTELAVAQCTFILQFSSNDDLPWAEAASTDYDACLSMLEKQFPSQPEATLFILEHSYGDKVIKYGTPYLAKSAAWSAVQQARLHASLSRAYTTQKKIKQAGEEAVTAAKLDPTNMQVTEAIRYLASSGHADAAISLLTSSPVPKSEWQEIGRINLATDLLPGKAALNELHRAQAAGLQIAAYTVARVLEHSGDSAGAQAVLDKASVASIKTPQYTQLRLDVAYDNHNAAQVAEILLDQYKTSGHAAALISAQLHLLSLKPSYLFRGDLFPLTAAILMSALFTICLPGLILFPAHYRGVVRQRIGKPSTPIFPTLGMRHAWLALAVFILSLYFGGALRSGTVTLTPNVPGVSHVDWETRVAVTHMWSLLFATIGLAWIARRQSAREWTGYGTWNKRWFIAPVLFVAVDVVGTLWRAHRHATGWLGQDWQVGLVHGAHAIGGLPLTLLVVCVAVPVIEEFVFRGCLLGGLSRHISFGWANIIQATVFAAMHYNAKTFWYLFVLAIIAGTLAKQTRGLLISILMHAAVNMIFVWMVLQARG